MLDIKSFVTLLSSREAKIQKKLTKCAFMGVVAESEYTSMNLGSNSVTASYVSGLAKAVFVVGKPSQIELSSWYAEPSGKGWRFDEP